MSLCSQAVQVCGCYCMHTGFTFSGQFSPALKMLASFGIVWYSFSGKVHYYIFMNNCYRYSVLHRENYNSRRPHIELFLHISDEVSQE